MKNLLFFSCLLIGYYSFGQEQSQEKYKKLKDIEIGSITPAGNEWSIDPKELLAIINHHFTSTDNPFTTVSLHDIKEKGKTHHYLLFKSAIGNSNTISLLQQANNGKFILASSGNKQFHFFSCEGFCEPNFEFSNTGDIVNFYCKDIEVVMDPELKAQFPCTKTDAIIEQE